MSINNISKAIFVTNTFANAHPQEHIKMWNQFEQEIQINQRTGPYGVENLAYIRWIKTKNNPIFTEFIKSNIILREV